MRLRGQVAVLLALGLAACSPEEQSDPLPSYGAFYFPTGLATTGVSGGTALLVASSNFDLRYSAEEGGTLLSVLPDPLTPALSPLRDGERIASYSGAVAVADGTNCPGIGAGASALVASRYDDVLYTFGIGSDGSLSCGAGCVRAAGKDPFAVGVACRTDGTRRKAYVGWLDPPDSTHGSGPASWITEFDLNDPAVPGRAIDLGDGPIRSMAYDQAADRLWFASQSSGARALLHSVVLSDARWSGPTPREAVDTVDLFPDVWGAELRSLAIGSPMVGAPQRIYATARLYDAESQASTGDRPFYDIGGVLLVMDVTAGTDGRPVVVVRGALSLGPSVGDVAVVRRAAPQRDVVVVTVLDGDLLVVYDAEAEVVAALVGHDTKGRPIFGDQPMALAVDQPSPGSPAWVYSAAFGGHTVTRFLLDPADPSASPEPERIGVLAP